MLPYPPSAAHARCQALRPSVAAILKVANAMDRSHKQKFKNVKTSVSGRNLIITIETEDDVTLEKGLFESKASFFEEVFSMKPVIKVKKVYS